MTDVNPAGRLKAPSSAGAPCPHCSAGQRRESRAHGGHPDQQTQISRPCFLCLGTGRRHGWL